MTSSTAQDITPSSGERREATTSTPSLGSTSEDGKPTGPNNLAEVLERLRVSIESQPEVEKPLARSESASVQKSSAALPQPLPPSLRDLPEAQGEVTRILEFCWK